MSSLKKAKKVIKINYCFENGDELEIPFIYKPAVMNHIKLQFDDYLLSSMREKQNRKYFAALLDSAIIYVKYSGELTKDFLAYNDLTFDDFAHFYESNIKGKPVSISIYGDANRINVEQLKKLGPVKIVELDEVIKI